MDDEETIDTINDLILKIPLPVFAREGVRLF